MLINIFCRYIIQVLLEIRQMWASWEHFNTSKTAKKAIYRIPGLGSEDILIYLIFIEVLKCELR